MATTPPLRAAVHTPPTPLHGGRYDTYHPYSTRKSVRRSTSRPQRAIHTPPPNSEDLASGQKKTSTITALHLYSPPSSTHTSPRKKVIKGGRPDNASAMSNDGSSSRAASLDPYPDPINHHALQQPALSLGVGMLPTPAKTPRKKPVQASAVNAAARVLFPVRPDTVEDAMPTPRKNKRNRRHVGFSLYSSMEDEDTNSENKIQIYTDSKDKVPELDPNEDNPFLERPSQAAPPPEPSKSRSSRKRKASEGAEVKREIEEAFNREEGMVYVFRGKKIFRKFPGDEPEADDVDDVEEADPEVSNLRPLTRASIKPRLLFPTPQQRAERSSSTIEDEEAQTDIEDSFDQDMTELEDETAATPVKQSFSPTTPPTTGHATRSATKKARRDSFSPTEPPEPVEAIPYPRKGKKVSPFDGWARTKASSGGGAVKGKKREGDLMERDESVGGAKKVKGKAVE